MKTPLFLSLALAGSLHAGVGVDAKPIEGAEVIIDGTQKTLEDKWKYWEGPGFKSAMPIKWKIVEDPAVAGKTALQTDDPAAAGGKYGAADIVTKKEYKDFRLHIEFYISAAGGNSGVYSRTATKSRSRTATRRSTDSVP